MATPFHLGDVPIRARVTAASRREWLGWGLEAAARSSTGDRFVRRRREQGEGHDGNHLRGRRRHARNGTLDHQRDGRGDAAPQGYLRGERRVRSSFAGNRRERFGLLHRAPCPGGGRRRSHLALANRRLGCRHRGTAASIHDRLVGDRVQGPSVFRRIQLLLRLQHGDEGRRDAGRKRGAERTVGLQRVCSPRSHGREAVHHLRVFRNWKSGVGVGWHRGRYAAARSWRTRLSQKGFGSVRAGRKGFPYDLIQQTRGRQRQ